MRYIEETLVAPLSYVEMIVGMLFCTVLRSVATAIGILVIAACFGVSSVENIALFLFWVVAVSLIFGLLGIIIGLWAQTFEQLNSLNVFFIAPLSMVGGVSRPSTCCRPICGSSPTPTRSSIGSTACATR